MRIERFQQRLRECLGATLETATPQNVREFIDSMQQELWRELYPTSTSAPKSRIEIRSAKPLSYESLIQSYFAQVLAANRDQSLIQLWLLALDLAYAGIEEMQAEKMDRLFTIDDGR
jgi:hypothetical protein